MFSGCRLGVGGSGAQARTWPPGGLIWSAAVGGGGAGLRSSHSGLGWAGVLQCVRSCGLVSAGGKSLRGLHSGDGGGWAWVSGGVCGRHWAGWACCGAWGSMQCVCAGRRLWGLVRGVQRMGPRQARAVVWAGGGRPCCRARGCARWWACVGRLGSGGKAQGRGFRQGVCCVGVCVRLQRCACLSCRPGGLEEKLAFFCGRGEDFADERAYLVHLLVSGGKRVR